MDYQDYYATLDVDRKATASEIQKAYRKLARKYHPDVNKSPEADAKFKEITEAYEVLKDDTKRAKYDQFGSAWKQAQNTGNAPPGYEDIFSTFGGRGRSSGRPGGGFGDDGFSSFFEMLFGGGGGGGGGSRGGGSRGSGSQGWNPGGGVVPPSDHEAGLTLTLEEAASGGSRQISLTDPVTGRKRNLKVQIPPGVRSGQRIRLAGQGGGSANGGPRGNLYLKVEVLPHPRFKLDGDRLRTELQVTPWEAALGGEAEVETLDGPLRVRIPAGSSSGRRIRLRGKGFPSGKNTSGDLIAEIRVAVPSELTDEEKDLFQQLSDVSAFSPRADGTT